MGAQSHPSTLSLCAFYYHDLTTRLRLLQHIRVASGDRPFEFSIGPGSLPL